MNCFQRLFLIILFTSAALGLLSRANAQAAHSSDYIHAPEMRRLLHWSHFPIRVYFTPGILKTQERQEAALAGFDEWVHTTQDLIKYQVVTTDAQANVIVTFLPDSSVPGKEGATGNTRLSFSGTALKQAQMVLATAEAAPADLQATAAHEFGHALGIDGHSDDPADIMFPTLRRVLAGSDLPLPVHNVTPRDLHTLKACYPALVVMPVDGM